MTDQVRHWAKIRLALNEARQRVYEATGITWQAFREIEQEAIAQLAGEAYVDTEYGRIQVKERPVWAQKDAKVIATNKSLILTER